MSQSAIQTLIAQIKAVAAAQPDPANFLKDLQSGIEEIPGAYVAFCTRDLTWLDGYLEGRGDISTEDRQHALFSASSRHEEGYASQDGISATMDLWLDQHYPVQDQEVEP